MNLYITFLESPDNSGIFARQVRPFKSEGFTTIIFAPAFKVTKKRLFSTVSRTNYSRDVFDKRVVSPFPSFSQYPTLISFVFCVVYLNVYILLLSIFVGRPKVIRVRGQLAAAAISLGPFGSTLEADVRGIFHDEARLLGRSWLTVASCQAIEKLCYRRTKKIYAVTRGVAAYIRLVSRRIDIALNEPKPLHRTGQTANRRSKSLVFLGALSPWNSIENLKSVLAENKTIREVTFLGARVQCETLEKAFPGVRFQSYRVPANMVFCELSKHEYGLVLGPTKRGSLTARTMVPSKLHEYIESGLFPILPNECSTAITHCSARGIKFRVF